MKATHRLFRWFRWEDERKYSKELSGYKAMIKKNGTIVFWIPMKGCKPYFCYLHSEKDAKIPRANRNEDGSKVRKYFTFYTLEAL